MGCPLVPCATCPWRLDSEGGVAIPNFSIEKARNLRNTVGPNDDFRPIMACHGSFDGEETPCIGYLVVEGWSNLRVRLAVIEGKYPLSQIMERCKDIGLYDSFEAMHGALELAEELRLEAGA